MLQKQDQDPTQTFAEDNDEDVERLFYSSIASPYTRKQYRIYLKNI